MDSSHRAFATSTRRARACASKLRWIPKTRSSRVRSVCERHAECEVADELPHVCGQLDQLPSGQTC